MNTAPSTPPSTPPPGQPETSIATGFALTLETACSDFEAMRRLIEKETRLVFATGQEDAVGQKHAQMALAKSFVFHLVRARRICEHGASSLKVERIQRRAFLQDTAGVLSVRDVNEHGFDVGRAVRGKSSKPSMHQHPTEGILVDETSMVVFDNQRIFMGPLNLYDLYVSTNIMRNLAGFRSLPLEMP